MGFRFFIFLIVLSLDMFFVIAQELDLKLSSIPQELKANANAVVRFESVSVDIFALDKMKTKLKRVVTVFNENGNKNTNLYQYYDNSIKISNLEVIVYDAQGSEIKKYRKKDFNNYSAVDDSTLAGDDRVLMLNFTPTAYPYTISFESEWESSSTAFISPWMPVNNYYLSTEYSRFEFNDQAQLGFFKLECNLEMFGIQVVKENHSLTYIAKDLKAIKAEDYSPSLRKIAPKAEISLKRFNLEGIHGIATSWEEFGKWYYENLLKPKQDLPEEAKRHAKQLVNGIEDPMERARIIYEYVQRKTRYISIQLGIGGWTPLSASKVDLLSYGDCKALTNYTQSLLSEVGVPSYYSVLFSSNEPRDIERDFVAVRGNHAFLTVPNKQDTLWLECTSQKSPFGYIAGANDDRYVLLISAEGGKIIKTKCYTPKENIQNMRGTYSLTTDGGLNAELEITSQGYQYEFRYSIQDQSKEDQNLFYKREWKDLDKLEITDLNLENDKRNIVFKETMNVKAPSFATKSGNRFLFIINPFHRYDHIPDKVRERELPIEIHRGYLDKTTFKVHIPHGTIIESIPESVQIDGPYGSYRFNVVRLDDFTLEYHRELFVNSGSFPKEEYEAFRDFRRQVAKADQSKISLIKN